MQTIVMEKAQYVFDLQHAILGTVADLMQFRDNTTGLHTFRTQKYLHALVNQLIDDNVYADELRLWNMDVVLPAVPLHDVGKISISDTNLNKPGRLTYDEFEIMKTHTRRGVEAIGRLERFGYFAGYLKYAKVFAGTHHEKWDGSGYPSGLRGQKIPLGGRIMAIADVYDELISTRPYKKALPPEVAVRIIIDGANTHFDPAIVNAFIKLSGEFTAIAKEYVDCSPVRMAM
jgi:putative two-component system response regulator